MRNELLNVAEQYAGAFARTNPHLKDELLGVAYLTVVIHKDRDIPYVKARVWGALLDFLQKERRQAVVTELEIETNDITESVLLKNSLKLDSEFEKQVVLLLFQGHNQSDIARILDTSKTHVSDVVTCIRERNRHLQ